MYNALIGIASVVGIHLVSSAVKNCLEDEGTQIKLAYAWWQTKETVNSLLEYVPGMGESEEK